MRDAPILFSAAMIRALIDGRKTMTRRLAWHRASTKKGSLGLAASPWSKIAIGDRLWVREEFSGEHCFSGQPPRAWPVGSSIWWWADGNPDDGDWTKPKPSIHMPRWASRLTLIVKAVKVEPLHAITIADVIADGIPPDLPLSAFPKLWNSLHGKGAFEASPEIVAISFGVHRCNIDALPREIAA